MIYYSLIITSIENAESYILATIFLVYTQVMHFIHQYVLLIYRLLLVVKYERLSGVELLIMLLVWDPYQMFVGHVTQIMLFLCVKHCRITLMAKLGAVSGSEIMCGGQQWNLRQDIYVLCYSILRSLVSLENPKNTWRGELILAKLQAISMLQPQVAFTVSKSTRTRCDICSKLKTEIENWRCSGVTVNNYFSEKCLPSNNLLGKKLLPQYLFNSK